MTGSDHNLRVYLGKNKMAELFLQDDQLYWHYDSDWQQAGYAVSPHLPLQGEIPSLNVQRFLRNFLPEGDGFDEIIRQFHLSQYNTFGLMRVLGLDMPGALVILPPNELHSQKASFRAIANDEMIQRLSVRDKFSMIVWDGKPRLSVAGVQDKINVVLDPQGQLGFGEGSLCSTHILKFEKRALSHLVLNEYFSMQLAKQCDLLVANVTLMRYEKHCALLVERFDRQFISMHEVKRRHVIDGCQALNLAPEYKYERNFGSGRDVAHIRDGASLKKLFEFSDLCSNPALVKQHMLDWVLFNILIFNYDAHGKNISFFVGKNGITLAPFYDLINIKMYPEFEYEMAMGLGDEFDEKSVGAYQLADFADECRLSRTLLVTRLRRLIKKLAFVLDGKSKFVVSDDENDYLARYKAMVRQRCDELLEQAGNVVGMQL